MYDNESVKQSFGFYFDKAKSVNSFTQKCTVRLCDKAKADFINVKSIGAKGDGTTDDTDILQYALDNYKTVYIPSGVFIISKGLKITQDETRITGNWKSSIIRLKSNTTVEYILSTNKTYRWTIENIRIDGNKSNGGVATYGLYHPEYSAESGTSFDNCLITKYLKEMKRNNSN